MDNNEIFTPESLARVRIDAICDRALEEGASQAYQIKALETIRALNAASGPMRLEFVDKYRAS